MIIDSGATAPLFDFHDTVLPSEDTDTVPSCFLYEAAAVDMLVEDRVCHKSRVLEPQITCVVHDADVSKLGRFRLPQTT